MSLTPEEIVSYDLKQTVRGYSVAQVDELLDRLADQVEAAQHEQERLAGRVRETEASLEANQETESTLKRTLVTAQQAAERALQEAREEADALLAAAREEARTLREEARASAEQTLAEARESASREAEEARRRRAALQERIDDLLAREDRYRQQVRDVLVSQLEELDALPGVDRALEHGTPTSAPQADPRPADEHDEPAGGNAPVAAQESDQTSPQAPASGLTVRVHGRPGGDQDQRSPLGSASPPEP
jgi:cell division initiation protein